jgi:hypothetical protein
LGKDGGGEQECANRQDCPRIGKDEFAGNEENQDIDKARHVPGRVALHAMDPRCSRATSLSIDSANTSRKKCGSLVATDVFDRICRHPCQIHFKFVCIR